MFHPIQSSAYRMPSGLGALCLYGLCIVSLAAGILLFLRPNLGKTLSLFMQAIQIPILMLGSLQYYVIIALGFALGFQPPSFLLFRYYLGRVEGSLLFGSFTSEGVLINFVALVFFFFALKSLRKNPAIA